MPRAERSGPAAEGVKAREKRVPLAAVGSHNSQILARERRQNAAVGRDYYQGERVGRRCPQRGGVKRSHVRTRSTDSSPAR